MTSLTTTYNPINERQLLSSLRDELALYQEESRFFHKILRKALLSGKGAHDKIESLISRLAAYRQETLPGLQKALRSLDAQNSNSTTADRGLSQVSLFSEGMEEARRRLNLIKREAFRELSSDFILTPIW
ncbi:MAG: hypothetical protein J5I98_16510 [Phaeodactylibacter sp.]|nr:hypothetical protein [Phaeodactylibacter sp.]